MIEIAVKRWQMQEQRVNGQLKAAQTLTILRMSLSKMRQMRCGLAVSAIRARPAPRRRRRRRRRRQTGVQAWRWLQSVGVQKNFFFLL